jgi:DMSO/TMAO reductase YedYZ molybdopterin-dependent catalytic subunit
MALFVVRHVHSSDRCPAQDPYRGAMLLNHLSRPNVAKFGLKIQGEAVVKDEHTMYLIVEAGDKLQLEKFLAPFEGAGSVEIFPASTCSGAVAAGGCGMQASVIGLGPGLNAEIACQDAIDSGLVVHRAHPLNCETSIPALMGGVVMPNARFYVRNHFYIPNLDPESYRLEVRGLVKRQLSLSLHELRAMRSHSQATTLECAGNGRSLFDPPIEGERWDLGAVSTAEWTGVPLLALLERAGVRTEAREVVFRGADGGLVDGHSEPIRFERSLRLDDTQLAGALLAYAMNGDPLPVHHGYPLRLVVPNWYSVASVKWLTEIELVSRPFTAYYQTEKYWYELRRDGRLVREPVTLQRVRALITEPAPGEEVSCGELTIRGVAWSGIASIARVEVSVGEGDWQEARLEGDSRQGSWRRWELITHLDQPGASSMRARATDEAGNIQPERAEWNNLGYGNNSIQRVPICAV